MCGRGFGPVWSDWPRVSPIQLPWKLWQPSWMDRTGGRGLAPPLQHAGEVPVWAWWWAWPVADAAGTGSGP